MKKIMIILLGTIFSINSFSQTSRITDWNKITRSGFYESVGYDFLNAPDNAMHYWGINTGYMANRDTDVAHYYNGQIAFAANFTVTSPQVYVRSTYITGEGTWAKLVHSKGDHAIDGKLTVKEVEIKVNTGADFVFESDYNLKPLSEVEQFVKTNKHLPEIPSEKQMIEEGVNVTDMQIKLLQKIEELTLYTIDLNKQVQELKKELYLKK